MNYKLRFEKGSGYWKEDGDEITIYAEESSIIHELIEASIGMTLKEYELCKNCEDCETYVPINSKEIKTGICHVATVLSRGRIPNYIKNRLIETEDGRVFFIEGK